MRRGLGIGWVISFFSFLFDFACGVVCLPFCFGEFFFPFFSARWICLGARGESSAVFIGCGSLGSTPGKRIQHPFLPASTSSLLLHD